MVVEDGWPQRLSDFPEGGEFDAILWQVKGRLLRDRPPFDWEGYPGPRIMLAHDTCRSYMQIAPGSDTLGMWPPMIHRQGFDLVLVSGKRVCELLRADGVPAVWMPKAYAADWLFDTGTDRGGIGYYGTPYPARRAMLDHLDRSSVAVTGFSEVAAAGTAPFCDPTPELTDLGFLDGHTAVVYSTSTTSSTGCTPTDHPDQLREIGRRAADLVANDTPGITG